MAAKAAMAEMEGAARRGQLLERKTVEFQASYLLACMRRQLLSLPGVLAPQLAGLTDVHEIRMALEGAARAVLEELSDFPRKVTNPRWIESLAEEDGEKLSPPLQGPPPQAKGKPPSSHRAAPGRRKPAPTS
jgi:hypothetical protein